MPSRKPLPQQFSKICIALGLPTVEKLLQHARAEIESGERFLEFRLDYLPDPADGAAAIAGFLEANPDASILATCRRHQNHGRFNGSIDEQIRILEAAVRHGACAVDVEIESAESAHGKLEHLRAETTLILSYHNYDATPPPESILKRMMKIPAHAYKVVTTAKKPNDSQKLLALAKNYPREKLILLAMGEAGFPHPGPLPRLGRHLHLRRAQRRRRHRQRPGLRPPAAQPLPHRKVLENRKNLRRRR